MVGYYASPGIRGHMRVSNPSNQSTHFGPTLLSEYYFCIDTVDIVFRRARLRNDAASPRRSSSPSGTPYETSVPFVWTQSYVEVRTE